MILTSDVSLVVRIAAFQAVDPGSSPGHRNFYWANIWNQSGAVHRSQKGI